MCCFLYGNLFKYGLRLVSRLSIWMGTTPGVQRPSETVTAAGDAVAAVVVIRGLMTVEVEVAAAAAEAVGLVVAVVLTLDQGPGVAHSAR